MQRSLRTVRVQPLVHVDLVGEGVTQSHGGEEHLHADDEVLVAGGDGALAHVEVGRVDVRDGAALLQDGQQEACSQEDKGPMKNRQMTNTGEKARGRGTEVGAESPHPARRTGR